MNKSITVALLMVILLAMGMVVFFHLQDEKTPAVSPQTSGAEQAIPSGNSVEATATANNRTAVHTSAGAFNSTGSSPSAQRAQQSAPVIGSSAPIAPAQPARETIQLGQPGTSVATPTAVKPEASTTVSPGRISAPEDQPAANTVAQPTQQPVPPAQASQTSQPGQAGTPRIESSTNATPPSATPAPAPSVTSSGTALTNLSLHFMDKGMVLRIAANNPIKVNSFILNNPERLVVDIPGKWENFKAPTVPSNKLVGGARTGRQGNSDRLVLDLKMPLKKQNVVKIDANTFEVRFE